MLKSFATALLVYFVVIDPIGNAPIFLTGLSVQYVIDGLAAIGLKTL